MEAGRIDTILDKLELFVEKCKEANNCGKYLTKNRKRLNYPYFRKQVNGAEKQNCRTPFKRIIPFMINYFLYIMNRIP